MPSSGRRAARAARAPLARVRVLSLAEQYPGPFATLILSDLGADVVLVERPGVGDPSRRDAVFFAALNRNKRSIALDLKHADGRAALLALARRADVLLEGFRPGAMDRLRLGYRDVARVNRRIVYASLSGFGQSGPYRDVPAHDISYQALSGMLHRQIGASAPEVPWLALGNVAGGLYAAVGILAALRDRERTRKGAYLDVAMLDGLVSLLTVPLVSVVSDAANEAPRDPGYGLFVTSDAKLLSLSIWGEDHLWTALCDAVGLSGARGLTFSQRARDPHLVDALREAVAAGTLARWTRAFKNAGVPFAPVLSLDAAARHPQVRARGMLVDVPAARGAKVGKAVRQPIRFDGAAPALTRGVPRLGEHTREVLREAGYTATRIEKLLASGAGAEA